MSSSSEACDNIDTTVTALLIAESEFVQSFSNPSFLQNLARSGQFSHATFVTRLGILHERWSKADRVTALRYPVCIEMLRLAATSEQFRLSCADDSFVAALRASQFGHWVLGSPVGAEMVVAAKEEGVGGGIEGR